MTRLQAENAIIDKLVEIVEIYHDYNPEGSYLSMSFVNGTVDVNNSYQMDDKKKPMDAYVSVKNDRLAYITVNGKGRFFDAARNKRFGHLWRWVCGGKKAQSA